MLITLYRRVGAGNRNYQMIFERDGAVVERKTCIGPNAREVEPRETVIGSSMTAGTDELLRDLVRDAFESGFALLYGYIPAPSYPLTSVHIRESARARVEPDPIDGLPVWPRQRNRRGRSPTYLLFTVLSSDAK